MRPTVLSKTPSPSLARPLVSLAHKGRRILVAEDEPRVRGHLEQTFRAAGFEADCVEDGEAALTAALAGRFDVIVLDLLLPKLSAIEVCVRIRLQSGVPILLLVPLVLLTDDDAELDRVLGVECGADDYVTKPVSAPELIARTRAVLRRRQFGRQQEKQPVQTLGGLRIDFICHAVVVEGKRVQLTFSEFKLLALLAREPERVFSRRQIMEHLWDVPFVGDERASDAHISNLRKKIEQHPARPERIVTVRNVGYKLVPG